MIAVILIWGICGFIAAGLLYAFFQNSFPESANINRKEDLSISLLLGCGGPIALIIAFVMTGGGEHGFWNFRK